MVTTMRRTKTTTCLGELTCGPHCCRTRNVHPSKTQRAPLAYLYPGECFLFLQHTRGRCCCTYGSYSASPYLGRDSLRLGAFGFLHGETHS